MSDKECEYCGGAGEMKTDKGVVLCDEDICKGSYLMDEHVEEVFE